MLTQNEKKLLQMAVAAQCVTLMYQIRDDRKDLGLLAGAWELDACADLRQKIENDESQLSELNALGAKLVGMA